MTVYESQIVLWTKISALSTCIGAIATFCAVCVALWQTKYNYRKRLKFELSYAMHLLGNWGNNQPYLTLTISNIGNREVQIDSWIIKGYKLNGAIMPSMVYSDGVSKLPITLKCEQRVMLMWEKPMFINGIRDLVNKGALNPNKRITFQIIDSVGKKYNIKTKNSINDILN